MAKVTFGSHLKRPYKAKSKLIGGGDPRWRSKIKAGVVRLKGKTLKVYKVDGADGYFSWANAKRVAKGYQPHRKENSVRAKLKRGEITQAQAKRKLGR